MNAKPGLILTINSGSSSLKTSLYRMEGGEALIAAGQLEGIGREHGRFRMKDADGRTLVDENVPIADHAAALKRLLNWFGQQSLPGQVTAFGHRVVHGGARFLAPQRITPELLAEVKRLFPFAPLHLPAAVAAIDAAAELFPFLTQVACFDTSFHRTLPEVAKVFAIPHRYVEKGIHRYGFHGLSYEYILEELTHLDPGAARGRVVVCHLGSGASMAAVRGGVCVDTTMGFSATGGLVMATRSGDLDPGVLLYLLAVEKMAVPDLLKVLNVESGLLGLSGISADMRELLEQGAKPAAKLAVDVFCYQARKFIGSLSAALGGLDTLIFTAGIGERSPAIRARICAELGYLGIELDEERNSGNARIVSKEGVRVTVRVMPTNEELMIARHTQRLT